MMKIDLTVNLQWLDFQAFPWDCIDSVRAGAAWRFFQFIKWSVIFSSDFLLNWNRRNRKKNGKNRMQQNVTSINIIMKIVRKKKVTADKFLGKTIKHRFNIPSSKWQRILIQSLNRIQSASLISIFQQSEWAAKQNQETRRVRRTKKQRDEEGDFATMELIKRNVRREPHQEPRTERKLNLLLEATQLKPYRAAAPAKVKETRLALWLPSSASALPTRDLRWIGDWGAPLQTGDATDKRGSCYDASQWIMKASLSASAWGGTMAWRGRAGARSEST